MPRPLHPLLPKGQTETAIMLTPASTLSPANFAPEVVNSPVVTAITTPKPSAPNMTESEPLPSVSTDAQPSSVAPCYSKPQSTIMDPVLDGMDLDQVISEARVHMNPSTSGPPADPLPYCYQDTGLPSDWPSEVYSQKDTTWLLPPYSDQSSTLALVLRTEIQSHNITREMLHSTEQRRLEAMQRCGQLEADNRSWAAAYNNITATLGRWAEEFSRLTTENMSLKTDLQIAKARHDHTFPKTES
jgi:hypothetical protein